MYAFPEPGLALRVIAPENVQISLNPVDFDAVPRIEIHIGVANNTRSRIVINRDQTVIDIPTNGILDANSWRGFRVVFYNWMVLVFREADTFPFMAWNVQEFYPITNYGIRTP